LDKNQELGVSGNAAGERHQVVTRPQKITFGEMREGGVRSVVISCQDYRCGHSTTALADGWSDDARLSDLELRFVCQVCGRRGADIRPNFDDAPTPRRRTG
jgi:hypothetical protein